MGEKITIFTTAEQFREGAENQKEIIEVDIENIENDNELKKLKNADAIIEALVEIIKDGQNIGTGRSAEVRMLEKRSDTCIKIIKDKSKTLNSAEDEMKLQTAARRAGARVPVPICSITTEKGYDFIVMETIKGHSVEDYKSQGLLLPEGFEVDKFIERAKLELEKMHNERIYHRDFHEGNLMIEEGALMPVIIDFGHAKEQYFSEDDPYKDTDIRGTTVYIDDLKLLKQSKKELYMLKVEQDKMKGDL